MIADGKRNLVIGITAQNENQALEMGSTSMGDSLIARGYRHRIIDMFQPSGGRDLMSALGEGDLAFAYGFAGVGSRLELSSGANIWTEMRVPFLCLWYDHPCYNYQQHIVDSPFVGHCYHVQDHLDARKKYLPASESYAALLAPLADVTDFAASRPVSLRPHQLLYSKTAYDPKLLSERWRVHPAALQELIWSLVEMAVVNRDLDLADATAALFLKYGESPTNARLLMGVVQEVDNYVRAWRGDKLGRALLKFPVHIMGRGWDYLKDEHHRAKFLQPQSAHKYYETVLEHKVVANSSPIWRDGIHERVYTGMSLASVVLTDHTVRSQKLLSDVPNYVGFEWSECIEDAVDLALARANDTSIDFYDSARSCLRDRIMNVHEDYCLQLERVVQEMQSRVEKGAIHIQSRARQDAV